MVIVTNDNSAMRLTPQKGPSASNEAETQATSPILHHRAMHDPVRFGERIRLLTLSQTSHCFHPWEKEKFLITGNFSFFQCFLLFCTTYRHFYRIQNCRLLTLSLNESKSHCFTSLQYKPFDNNVGKGEIAHDEQFLRFPQCFLPFCITYRYFHRIQSCRLLTL